MKFVWSDIFVITLCLCIVGIIVWFKWKACMYPHQVLEDALRHNEKVVRVYCVDIVNPSTGTHYGVIHRDEK